MTCGPQMVHTALRALSEPDVVRLGGSGPIGQRCHVGLRTLRHVKTLIISACVVVVATSCSGGPDVAADKNPAAVNTSQQSVPARDASESVKRYVEAVAAGDREEMRDGLQLPGPAPRGVCLA